MKQLLVWCLFRSWMLFMQMMIKCLSFHQAQLFFNVLAKYLFVCLPKKIKVIAHKNLSLVYLDLSHEAREQRIKCNLGDFLMMPYYMALSFYGSQKLIDVIEKKGLR